MRSVTEARRTTGSQDSARKGLPMRRLWSRALTLRCVLCGKDRPFTGTFGMRKQCRKCGFVYERERGYFLGSADINFWVTFVLLVPIALGGYILLEDPGYLPVYWSLAFVVAFPLWFFRYSKTLYMLIDLWLDPPTEADFRIRETAQGAPAPGATTTEERETVRGSRRADSA